MVAELLKKLADDAGGELKEAHSLPDGHGFATMSLPLPADHWLTQEGCNVPPMPFRVGVGKSITVAVSREEFANKIWSAARHAIRGATMNGKEMGFDPDALIQNLVVGMLGYWSEDGLGFEDWMNPPLPKDPSVPWPSAQYSITQEWFRILENASEDLRVGMNADLEGYAWARHCAIAKAEYDAGASHRDAHRIAARAMLSGFGVDTWPLCLMRFAEEWNE